MIVAGIIFLILLLVFIINICHDKIILLNTKVNLIEEKLNSTLIKKKELIKESEKIIKEVLNTDKTIYENLYLLDEPKQTMIELDRNITISLNDFYLIKEKYKQLNSNEDFQKILFSINETSDQLLSYKTYYNNIINDYNKIIKKFPYVISTTLKGKRKKLFFDN